MSKDWSNKTIAFISAILIKVFREFGLLGVITYAAGLISLGNFLWIDNFNKQILFGVIGVTLFALSTFIAYIRMRKQNERETRSIS